MICRSSTLASFIAATLGVAAFLVPLRAQNQDPPKPLFGRTPDTLRPTTLVSGSVFGGSGTSLNTEEGEETRAKRAYSGFLGSFAYQRRRPSWVFTADLGTSLRYYVASQQLETIYHAASLGLQKRLSPSTRLGLSQSVRYTPFHQLGRVSLEGGALGGALPPIDPESAVSVGGSYDLGMGIDILRTIGQRTSLTASYVTRANLSSSGGETNLFTQRGAVGLRWQLAPYAALVTGTGYRVGQAGVGSSSQPTTAQDIDIGFDINRPLTFSRRTRIALSSGSAIVSKSGTGSLGEADSGRRFRAIGNATLIHQLTRYWEGSFGYDRSLQFVDGFPEPFYGDGGLGRLTGRFGQRVAVTIQAHYSRGQVLLFGPEDIEQRFEALQTQARLAWDASRRWQFFAEHHYAENRFSAGAGASLPPGIVPRRFARGVRGGLNLWLTRVH